MNWHVRDIFSWRFVWAGLAGVFLSGLSGCGSGEREDLAAIQTAIDTRYATQGQATLALDVQYGDVGPSLTQADGKLLIAGWRQTAPLPPNEYGGYPPRQVYVMRLNGDGSRDTSFGVGGEARVTVKGSDTVADFKLQPDGKILLAVNSIEPCLIAFLSFYSPCLTPSGDTATPISAMVRLTAQGMLDSAFGVGGTVQAPANSGNRLALAVQADGRVLLLRSTSVPRSRIFGWALARYNADGTPDLTFNQGNAVTSTCQADGVSMVIQPDGRIVVGGAQDVGYAEPAVNPGLCLERINGDGSHDVSFGAGSLWTALNANVSLHSMSLLPGANLLAVGRSCDLTGCELLAARYDPDGRLDPSFGVASIVRLAIDKTLYLVPTGHLVTPGGDLVMLATQTPGSIAGQAPTYQPVWIRLDANGQAVSGFGVNGVLVGTADTRQPKHLLQDSQGRWLMTQQATLPDGNLAIVVTRLRGDSQ